MIKKINPGDSQIPASGWNEMRDFVNNYEAQQRNEPASKRNPFLITVKNATGAALPALSVVRIAAPTYSRSGDTFADKGVEFGVEMNGSSPSSDDDNVAIIQGACPNNGFVKAIADGCTPAFVYKNNANEQYRYAKPIANQTEYLEGTNDPTNIVVLWHDTGSGKQEAYIRLDAAVAGDKGECFIINHGKQDGDTPIHTPTIFTKGSLHYIYWTGNYWEPVTNNEAQNGASLSCDARLVYCREDAPHSAAEYSMPYYSPEMNYGEPPNVSATSGETFTNRCGVVMGEHKFSNKRIDYIFKNKRYAYEPIFLQEGYAVPGTVQAVGIAIEGKTYDVQFKITSTLSYSLPHFYPDIWEGDNITVKVDASGATPVIRAIEYPIDFKEGTYLLTDTMYGSGNDGWRGWEDMTNALFGNLPNNTVISVYQMPGSSFGASMAAGQDITGPTLMSIDDIVGTGMRIYQKTKPAADGCLL